MTADRGLLAKARRELQEDAAAHRKRQALLRERLYGEEPRLSELGKQIRRVFLDALSSSEAGAVKAASVQSLTLQEERASLLRSMGASPEILEDEPLCPVCNDTGMTDGEMCACLLERYHALQTAELSGVLRNRSFGTFDLNMFSDAFDPAKNGSPRRNMEDIRELCQYSCAHFETKFENMVFYGSPGTGKTFLAVCVAGAVSKHGFSVTYGTAAHHLGKIETLHFGRGNDETEEAVERLTECDLLIIDDLGAEFVTPFSQSALLDLVNTRVVMGKKMVVCTNLGKDNIQSRYNAALASRLEGEFLWLPFFGRDLRQERDV